MISIGPTHQEVEELLQASFVRLRTDMMQKNLEIEKKVADLKNKHGSLLIEFKNLKAKKIDFNNDVKDKLTVVDSAKGAFVSKGRPKKLRK